MDTITAPVQLRDPIQIGKLNFDCPVVVLFAIDDEGQSICEGIAYNKEIICLCCGGVVPLDEVNYLAYDPDNWPTIELF